METLHQRRVGDDRGVFPAVGLGGTVLVATQQYDDTRSLTATAERQVALIVVAVPIGGVVVLDHEHSLVALKDRSAMSRSSPRSEVLTSWRTTYGPAGTGSAPARARLTSSTKTRWNVVPSSWVPSGSSSHPKAFESCFSCMP